MTESHLLAINTVTGCCSVAVSNGTILLNKKTILADRGHSEIIIPLIETVLKESGLHVDNLTGFLVCTGPGNYTSLRIAISVTRAFALARNKPACGISLFELLSTNQPKVLVLVKGPEEKIYTQEFSNGLQVNAPRLLTLDEIKKTEEFFGCTTIGYQAKKIGKVLNSESYVHAPMISFNKFFAIGLNKLKKGYPRPSPIYIK
ncbi:MAG: tRNA (adenosine(37)-N6)-threonylcarbamoyltransferase complex dimerization subunit type 1 TsaB [Paracoccaceae bacterium]|nr:tRNA (adenosine(37)-N6)-threonylcarbamoyltransferase complex dimerization subunit type 1 TsaB [Paracoccaceae bacterium]